MAERRCGWLMLTCQLWLVLLCVHCTARTQPWAWRLPCCPLAARRRCLPHKWTRGPARATPRPLHTQIWDTFMETIEPLARHIPYMVRRRLPPRSHSALHSCLRPSAGRHPIALLPTSSAAASFAAAPSRWPWATMSMIMSGRTMPSPAAAAMPTAGPTRRASSAPTGPTGQTMVWPAWCLVSVA